MAQTYNDDFPLTGIVGDDIPRFEQNFATLKSNFSGSVFPTSNLVKGMLCTRTDRGFDLGSGNFAGIVYEYSGDATHGESGWIELVNEDSAIVTEIVNSRGTKNTLDERLDISMNDDGTLKDTVTAVINEFQPLTATLFTYISTTSFKTDNNTSDIWYPDSTAGRRVKITLGSSTVYASVVSAVYAGGPDETTVVISDAVLDNTLLSVDYALISPYRGALGGSLETGIQVAQPTIEAGTIIIEGVQLDLGILNYSADLIYTIIPTDCTIVNNNGTLEITNPTSATPSFTISANTDIFTNATESEETSRSLTTTLATPSLDSPADEAKNTDVTYTISDISANADKVIFDPQSANFTYGSVGSGTGTRVGDLVEITGWSGSSVTITLQYIVDATYTNRCKSTEVAGNYTDSAYATDSITIEPQETFAVSLTTGIAPSSLNIDASPIGSGVNVVMTMQRTGTASNVMADSESGTGKNMILDSTPVQNIDANGVTAFNASSVDVGSQNEFNQSTISFLNWMWSLPTYNATNNDGTIQTEVRNNDYSSFGKYAGGGPAGSTIGHGIGIVPDWVIVMVEDKVESRQVQTMQDGLNHYSLDTNAAKTAASNRWNNTAPNSTTITLGNDAVVNGGGFNYQFMAFANFTDKCYINSFTVSGGSISGGDITPFTVNIRAGIFKRKDSTGSFYVIDDQRTNALKIDVTDTEATVGANPVDISGGTISNVSLPDGDYDCLVFAVGA